MLEVAQKTHLNHLLSRRHNRDLRHLSFSPLSFPRLIQIADLALPGGRGAQRFWVRHLLLQVLFS
jgi:hypothetical protein